MISIVNDLRQCKRLWKSLIPPQSLFDLWEVRACFQKAYGYCPCFIVAEGPYGPKGLLALSHIEDYRYWGSFPGETFKGKTWLEQNRIISDYPATKTALLEGCPASVHLRYLDEHSAAQYAQTTLDEVGYLFRPADYDYDFNRYMQTFSGKRRKSFRQELDAFEGRGVTYRYNEDRDIDRVFELNMQTFGKNSYFSDDRFLAAFLELLWYLRTQNMLRVTTVLVAGQLAAVDVGALYRGVYTVLAGGTNPDLPGIAKVINFHHLEWACQEHLAQVDFLCGDFGWKQRFHLTARPLYQLRIGVMTTEEPPCHSGELSHAG
ncbi:GNAT family N-acetyltransferase [Planctomycetota bacterium]